MIRFLFLALASILVLSACNVPAVSVPTETPTATPLPPTATLEPTPTPDPIIFMDDFEGALGEGWNWVREDPKRWSLTANPGWLQIMAGGGGIQGGTVKNLLMREAPQGDFLLETHLKFKPKGNFQIGALVIYESNNHFAQFGRAFCSGSACAGDGFYMDLTREGRLTVENFATKAPGIDTVYLRLMREGSKMSGLMSEDRVQWTLIGAKIDDLQPLFVGLYAGQAAGTVPAPAQFDYFLISKIP